MDDLGSSVKETKHRMCDKNNVDYAFKGFPIGRKDWERANSLKKQ